jgi:glycosyltransferase involved in cell wall biosynthesis
MAEPVMSRASPALSIIIPAFNEERRLPRALSLIREFIEAKRLDAEVIVVDDGSTDGSAAAVHACRDQFSSLTLLSTGPRNHGKGFAVRTGMLAARGRIALFTDADLSAPIEEAEKLMSTIEAGADVALGSRHVSRARIEVHQSALREFAGRAFNAAVRLLTGLPYLDTQCGFKAFRMPQCRPLFELQRIEDYGFDPEILFLAQRLGLRCVEVPIRWAHDPHSKIRVLRDGLRMLADLVAIRANALAGKYPRV